MTNDEGRHRGWKMTNDQFADVAQLVRAADL